MNKDDFDFGFVIKMKFVNGKPIENGRESYGHFDYRPSMLTRLKFCLPWILWG
jgi:hypothetical protein